MTEAWSSNGSNRTVNGNKVRCQSSISVYGTKLVSSGKYEWKVKGTFSSASCQWIGIASQFTSLSGTFDKPYSVWWYNGSQYIQGNVSGSQTNLVQVNPFERWQSGDCITVKLNLYESTVSFYKNDNKQAHATYTNLPKAAYKLAVYGSCSYGNDEFTIVSSTPDVPQIVSVQEGMLSSMDNSIRELKKFQKQVKEMEIESLLTFKQSIGKFRNQHEVVKQKLSTYSNVVTKVSKLIDDELNPKDTDYHDWGLKKVVRFICTLENGRFAKYKQTLQKTMSEQQFTGKDLQDLDKTDLSKEFGVKNFGDRTALFQAIQKLIRSSEGDTTASIRNTSSYGASRGSAATKSASSSRYYPY